MSANRPNFRRWSLRCLGIGFVLAVLTAIILYAVLPPQYPAVAQLQIRSTPPTFLYETTPQSKFEYDIFTNTQIALMRSPTVLDTALQNPEVTQLPLVKQRDIRVTRAFLANKLRIKREKHSEIVSVSIKTDSEEASIAIVNAVVEAYLKYVEDSDRNNGNRLIVELHAEKRRQHTVAQSLQESIRSLSKADDARSEEAQHEIAFMLPQLSRVNKIIDRIDDRILSVQASARAPGQIVHLSKAIPLLPDTREQFIGAGIGFIVVGSASIVVFFAIMFLGIMLDFLRFLGIGKKKCNSGSHYPVCESESEA